MQANTARPDSTTAVSRDTIAAMRQRGRTRMVQAVINEGGLINPNEMHTYWRGFAQCAKALLDGSAQVMASHDKAGDTQSTIQAALARLPNDVERLTLADMKRHMWAKGIDFTTDAVPDSNVNAVVQLQDGISTAFKANDEHAIAPIEVGDGGRIHGDLPVVQTPIVKESKVQTSQQQPTTPTSVGIDLQEGALCVRLSFSVQHPEFSALSAERPTYDAKLSEELCRADVVAVQMAKASAPLLFEAFSQAQLVLEHSLVQLRLAQIEALQPNSTNSSDKQGGAA